MSFLTKYGTLWGQVPFTTGRIHFVSPADSYNIDGRAFAASNDNDGLSPEKALRTLAQAVSNANADQGEVIFLLPGAHSWTASVALSKAGLTILGMPGNHNRPRTSITVSAADEIINITAADIEIANLRIIPVTAQRGIDFTTAAARLHVHDCSIDLSTPAANAATIGLGVTGSTQAPAHLWVHDNWVDNSKAQGPWLTLGDCQDFLIENNLITVTGAVTWAVGCSQDGVLGYGVHRFNHYIPKNGATLTAGCRGTDITSASAVHFYGNFFGDDVTVPIEDFGAGDAVLVENYKGSIGGGSGGVLITAIT